jgi:hypothetical protein
MSEHGVLTGMNTQNTADRVTLSLPQSVRQRLDAYAADQRRSRSNAAALLLGEALRVMKPRTQAEAVNRA